MKQKTLYWKTYPHPHNWSKVKMDNN